MLAQRIGALTFNGHVVHDDRTGVTEVIQCHSPVQAVQTYILRHRESFSNEELKMMRTMSMMKQVAKKVGGDMNIIIIADQDPKSLSKEDEVFEGAIFRLGPVWTLMQCNHILNVLLAATKFAELVALTPEKFTQAEQQLASWIDVSDIYSLAHDPHNDVKLPDEDELNNYDHG